MKLSGIDLNELRDGPHKANVKSLFVDFCLFDGAEIHVIFWYLYRFLFFSEIADYIFDLALILL